MKAIFSIQFVTIILFTITVTAQKRGIVIDSSTNEPIPYVNIWVENESIGATADEKGYFEIREINPSDEIIVSAVGYAARTLKVTDIDDKILLTPQPILLKEVLISRKPRKGKHKLVIKPFKEIEQEQYTGLKDIGPFMLARLVPYKEAYKNTPYINKIRFKVREQKNKSLLST